MFKQVEEEDETGFKLIHRDQIKAKPEELYEYDIETENGTYKAIDHSPPSEIVDEGEED